MNSKKIITDKITENHKLFMEYLGTLSDEEFEFSTNEKWTAGQHLEHIVLCIKATLGIFSMDKFIIEKTFGRTDRKNRTSEDLLSDYNEKLTGGGKAPSRFVPETITIGQREILIETLTNLIKDLIQKIGTFSDRELECLQIPHPLLGYLTLREMMFNVISHVEHHQELTSKQLMNKSTNT